MHFLKFYQITSLLWRSSEEAQLHLTASSLPGQLLKHQAAHSALTEPWTPHTAASSHPWLEPSPPSGLSRIIWHSSKFPQEVHTETTCGCPCALTKGQCPWHWVPSAAVARSCRAEGDRPPSGRCRGCWGVHKQTEIEPGHQCQHTVSKANIARSPGSPQICWLHSSMTSTTSPGAPQHQCLLQATKCWQGGLLGGSAEVPWL